MSEFASGRHSNAICDICGVRTGYQELKEVFRAGYPTNVFACNYCWDKDHPQLFLGRKPIKDPQSLRRARPDPSLLESRQFFDKTKLLQPPIQTSLGNLQATRWSPEGVSVQYGVGYDLKGNVVNSLTEDFSSGNHRIKSRFAITPNANITMSVNVKATANPSPYIATRMESDDIVTAQYTDVFFWTGPALAYAGVGSVQGTGVGISRTVTSLGNDWYNITSVMNLGSGLSFINIHFHARDLSSTSYVGLGRVAFYYTNEPVIS